MGNLDQLRYEPIEKRIRAMLAGQPVVDTQRALLVWEPKRVVPSYGIPADELEGVVSAASESDGAGAAPAATAAPRLGDRPVYDPSVPFAVHTTAGRQMDVSVADAERPAAAFAISDDALDGYVLLDFGAFDAWYEEDERNVSHPRDPFHRIEIVHSSRTVQVESHGRLLAQSTDPYLLFESMLPVRYYLPADDVVAELLHASATTTACAYKGWASYLSLHDEADIAWTYSQPLREAAEVKDRIAFFNERVDLVVNGIRLERPVTPWSRR
jgi:uncharacterized protein (DUF427 family)